VTEPAPTVEAIAEQARRLKRDVVRKYGDYRDESLCDITNVVFVVRNGQPRIMVMVGEGQDATRQCVYWSAAVMQADELYLVADTRYREYPDVKDREGAEAVERTVKHGDFQRDWQAGRRDGLTEALILQRLPAMGPMTITTYPYVRTGRQLVWQKHPIAGQPNEVEGVVPDYARQGYNDARAANLKGVLGELGDLIGIPEDLRSHHTDRAMARFVSEKKGVGGVIVLDDHSLFVKGKETTHE
jgi:hypothetical protein